MMHCGLRGDLRGSEGVGIGIGRRMWDGGLEEALTVLSRTVAQLLAGHRRGSPSDLAVYRSAGNMSRQILQVGGAMRGRQRSGR